MKIFTLAISLIVLTTNSFAQLLTPLSFKKNKNNGEQQFVRLNFEEACPDNVPIIDSVFTKGTKCDVTFASPDMTHCGEMKGYINYAVTNGTMPQADVWVIYFHDKNATAYAATVASSDRATPSVVYALFDASVQSKKVTCNWVTEEEIGNYMVEVERSFDGQNYKTVAIVFGKEENCANTQSYKFIDKTACLLNNQMAHYRLKQIDVFGNVTFSKIVSVKIPHDGSKTIAVK